MERHQQRIEYLSGRIEALKAKKKALLRISSAAWMESEAREVWAGKLDTVLERLRRYTAEIDNLKREKTQR